MEHSHDGHTHHHHHSHGTIDPSLLREEQGIRAVKYCFCVLAATAIFQIIIVFISGSVALFADTIHNIADACTSIPLWIAFVLARRKPSLRFTYGYGRFEDLAGLVIVFIIVLSAGIIGYQSIIRLLDPTPVTNIPTVIAAAFIGFAGNEFVARYRIRIGKKIDSAALVADGYHARVDSYTSLAVVLSAVGAWFGWHSTDPIIGLAIVVILCKIIYESSAAVLTRLLDGVDPQIVETIRRTVGQLQLIHSVDNVRARWSGHRLYAEVSITLNGTFPIAATHTMEHTAESLLKIALPSLEHVSFHMHPLLNKHT